MADARTRYRFEADTGSLVAALKAAQKEAGQTNASLKRAGTGNKFAIDITPVVAALRKVKTEVGQTTAASKKFDQGVADNIRTLTRLGVGLGIVLPSLQGIIGGTLRAADSQTSLSVQLKLASASAAEAAIAQQRLFEIAQRSGVETAALGTVYTQLAYVGQELGIEQGRLLTVTEAIGNAMATSAGSAQGMQGALIQLSQGLSAGVLRGEELNSILDGAPGLALALAKGLGVARGELRALGAAGELTAEKVINALEKSAPELARQVAEAAKTTSQGFTNLREAIGRFIGQADGASGATQTLVGALNGAAGGITSLGDAIKDNREAIGTVLGATAGVAAAAGVGLLAKNIVAAGVAAKGLGLALLANPAVLAVLGIGAAGGALAFAATSRTTAERIDQLTANIEELEQRAVALDAKGNSREAGRLRGVVQENIEERFGLGYRTPEQAARERLATASLEAETAAAGIADASAKIKRSRDAFMAEYQTDGEKLAAEIAKYDAAFKGKVSESQRATDIADIREKYRTKGKKKDDGLPELNVFGRNVESPQAAFRMAELEQQPSVASAMVAAEQEAREAQQQRVEYARDAATSIREANTDLSISLIRDDEARGQAILAIEREVLAERIAGLKEGTAERMQAEADLADFVILRNQQLVEELKPTWQVMLDEWRDTTQSMKRFSDEFMTGFLDEGKRTWVDWATSGRLTTKGLTDFIKQEFLRLAYEQYLSQATANLGKTILKTLLNNLPGLLGMPGGGAFAPTGGSGLTLGGVSVGGGGGGLYSLGTKLATGTNYVPYDGFRASLHKGEAVVPVKYNPAAGGMAAPAVNITQNVTVGEGVTRGEVYQAVKSANAELMQMLMRSRNRDGAFA